ncbi:hypothetical protein JKP88DRAFT_352654 [Tribonema minus]|uniref:PROP1-like PPR domain-containing protein n=1 Tax=Tribonema minus TaxID=303371 RepID=A0A835ZA61_9STRA|nr:hypothetical protein JKP88DRAFT_352654 [Tribonema minus]
MPNPDAIEEWRNVLLRLGPDLEPALPPGVSLSDAYAAALSACVRLKLQRSGSQIAAAMDAAGMLERDVPQAVATNAIILFAARKMLVRALDLYDRLPELGLRADIAIYTALLKRLTHDEQWEDATRVVSDALASEVLDQRCLGYAVRTVIQTQGVTAALELVKSQRLLHKCKLTLSRGSFSELVAAAGKEGGCDMVEAVIGEMVEAGVKLTPEVEGARVLACARAEGAIKVEGARVLACARAQGAINLVLCCTVSGLTDLLGLQHTWAGERGRRKWVGVELVTFSSAALQGGGAANGDGGGGGAAEGGHGGSGGGKGYGRMRSKVYAAAIQACKEEGRWEEARSLLAQARAEGVPPCAGMLKGVLQACGKAGQPAAAREAFESVRASGLHPDSFCWGALMKAHRQAGQWQETVAVFDELLAAEARGEAEVNDYCCKSACIAMEYTRQANKALEYTRQANKALEVLCDMRNCRGMRVLRDMRDRRGMRPGRWTYAAVIGTLTKAGLWQDALTVLDTMLEGAGGGAGGVAAPPVRASAGALRRAAVDHSANLKAFGYALSAAAQGRRWEKALPLLRQRSESDSLRHKHLWEKALALLRQLSDSGTHPTTLCYNCALSACVRAQRHEEALQLFRLMLQHWREGGEAAPDAFTYNYAIAACAGEGDADGAVRLLAEMRLFANLKPSTVCFNRAIGACDKAGRWQMALDLVAEMRLHSLQPDIVTYTAAMTCCNNAKQWTKSLQLWEELQATNTGLAPGTAGGGSGSGTYAGALSAARAARQRSAGAPVVPNVHAYGACIQAYAIGRRYLQAIQTLREMQNRGLRPSQACYGAAINACTRSGKWEVAVGLLREMKRKGIPPSVQCYTSAIAACGEGKQWEQAIALLDQMVQEGVTPNDLTFAAVIQCYIAAITACGRCGNADGALELLHSSDAQDGVKPNLFTYTDGVKPNLFTYTGKEAVHLLREMRAIHGIKPNAYSYTAAVEACSAAGQAGLAVEVLEDMKGDGIPMTASTYAAAIRACRQHSQWLFALGFAQDMTAQGIQKTLPVYSAAVEVLLDSNHEELALEFTREGLDTGVINPWSSRDLGTLDLARLPPALSALVLKVALQDMRAPPPPDTARYVHRPSAELNVLVGTRGGGSGGGDGGAGGDMVLERVAAVNAVLEDCVRLRLVAAEVLANGARFTLSAPLLRQWSRGQ